MKSAEEKKKMRPFWVTFYISTAMTIFLIWMVWSSDADLSETFHQTTKERVNDLEFRSNNQFGEIRKRLSALENELKYRIRNLELTKTKEKLAQTSKLKLAEKIESMSDQDYQAMVLENLNPSERRIVEQHFKRENAFKTSLNPTQKKAFDVDVNREYAKLLASSVVEGELSDLLKKSLRRSAESMVIADWRGRASRDRKNAELNAHLERRKENLRVLQEEFLVRIG